MKFIFTDIDGVLTDGSVLLDARGNESKRICYRDLDAIGIGRKLGFEFGVISGENTPITSFLAKRFGIELAYLGIKDKLALISEFAKKKNISLKQIIYIGDSNADVALIESVGLGIAPADAASVAKKAAGLITLSNGGMGVLFEIVSKLNDGEIIFPKE
jgi:YrbI family 3-deoxy-D-manno-octulosonate 8-phosphate phosphatase